MELVKVIEPRVNVRADTEQNHVVLMGGSRVTEQTNIADSWGSVGQTPVQAVWTINPPSTSTIVDREMKLRCFFEVTTDAPVQLGLNDALRQFPVSSLADVVTVQINGETVSDNVADKLHAMLCYGNDVKDRKRISETPVMPDQYQEYADWQTYGSAKNALGDYGESFEGGRGGFPIEVISPTVFRTVVTEPIFLSPFLTGMHAHQEEGFINVNQLNVSFRWKSNLSQIISHSSAGNAITTVNVTMYRAPELLTTFITPDLTQQIPSLQVLPYQKSQEYIKTIGVLGAGESTTVLSDSIRLSQVPRRVYLFCRHQRSGSTQDTTDSFLGIESLSMLWNNQSGLFSSAKEQDLYKISKSNGLNLSWPQWHKYRGAVFCAEFGKDIGLIDSEAPGVQGQYTLSVQMGVKNHSTQPFTGEFFMVVLNQGTFSISENFARASLGNLTPQMVLMAKSSPEMNHLDYYQLQGSGFWSSLKGIVNKVARGVQSVASNPFVQKAVGALAPEFSPLLSGIGGVASSARNLSGGLLSGGSRMKRLSRKTRR